MVALSRPARPFHAPGPVPTTTLALLALVSGAAVLPVGPAVHSAAPATRTTTRATGLVVAIVTPSPVVDPSVPFTLHAEVAGGLPPFEYLWTSTTLGSNRSANWTVSLGTGATTTFSLEVADAASDWGTANLSVQTGLPLAVSATATSVPVDEGEIVPVNVSVAGGVAPYSLRWTAPDEGESGVVPIPSPGTTPVPVAANATGPGWVELDLTDSVGGEATYVAALPRSCPLPIVTVTSIPGEGEVGHPWSLVAAITGGAPPLSWKVNALGPVTSTSSAAGSAVAGGAIQWSGSVAAAGNLSVVVDVVDARGSSASDSVMVPIVAAVSDTLVVATLPVANGTPLLLSGAVAGGLPPYRYAFSLGDGESATGNLTTPGEVNWTATPLLAGYVVASFGVTDALGYSTETTLTVRVMPATANGEADPSPSGSEGAGTVGPWIAALLLVTVTAYGALRYARARRRRVPARAEPPELALLERWTSSPDGVDRERLEELAKGEEISPGRLNQLLAETERDGRIERWSHTDGERLHWAGTASGDGEPLGTADLVREA